SSPRARVDAFIRGCNRGGDYLRRNRPAIVPMGAAQVAKFAIGTAESLAKRISGDFVVRGVSHGVHRNVQSRVAGRIDASGSQAACAIFTWESVLLAGGPNRNSTPVPHVGICRRARLDNAFEGVKLRHSTARQISIMLTAMVVYDC